MRNDAATATGHLAEAREKLDRVCEQLLAPSPEALDGCAPWLQSAVQSILACRLLLAGPRQAEAGALQEGRRLRLALRRARCLVESAAGYHRNSMRRMGIESAGYDHRGAPLAFTHRGRLSLRG